MKTEDFKLSNQNKILYIYQKPGGEEEIPVLRYPLFDQLDFVTHCFTTRAGGVSQGIYSSLNLSYSRGDRKEAVDENFRRVAAIMNASLEDFVLSDQTHTTNIRKVTEEDRGKGLVRERDYQDIDGLITNVPGLVLAAFFADCVPLFFADPVHRAIGLSHSGWRGTIGGIGPKTIERMGQEYGSRPEDIRCAIGPSICQACYEVGEEVADQFLQAFPKAGRELCYPTVPGKYQLNLWEANRLLLEEAGILPDHLAVTNICTSCNSRLLFSHRASKGRRGNLGAFLKINIK